MISSEIIDKVVYALWQSKPYANLTEEEHGVFCNVVEELSKLGFIPANEFSRLILKE